MILSIIDIRQTSFIFIPGLSRLSKELFSKYNILINPALKTSLSGNGQDYFIPNKHPTYLFSHQPLPSGFVKEPGTLCISEKDFD